MLSRNMAWFPDPSVLHLWGGWDPGEQPNLSIRVPGCIPAVNVGVGNNVRLANQVLCLDVANFQCARD